MISCLLINMNNLPYKLNNDKILLKVKVYDENELINEAGIRINIRGNIGINGSDIQLAECITNEYGVSMLEFNTNNLQYKNFNTALFYAEITTPTITIKSNAVRCNFIENVLDDTSIIDAGTCGNVSSLGSRSNFPIYDATVNRQNSYIIVRPGM